MISRKPDFVIYQGSTPCLELVMPVELESSDVIYVTFCQDDAAMLEYRQNGTAGTVNSNTTGTLEIDEENACNLQVLMSQADTLRLELGDVALQVRIRRTESGDTLADTLPPLHGVVGKALKGGII